MTKLSHVVYGVIYGTLGWMFALSINTHGFDHYAWIATAAGFGLVLGPSLGLVGPYLLMWAVLGVAAGNLKLGLSPFTTVIFAIIGIIVAAATFGAVVEVIDPKPIYHKATLLGGKLKGWSDRHRHLVGWACFAIVAGAIGAGVGHHWPTSESIVGGAVGAAIGFTMVSLVGLYVWVVERHRQIKLYMATDNETWAEAGLYPYPSPPDA